MHQCSGVVRPPAELELQPSVMKSKPFCMQSCPTVLQLHPRSHAWTINHDRNRQQTRLPGSSLMAQMRHLSHLVNIRLTSLRSWARPSPTDELRTKQIPNRWPTQETWMLQSQLAPLWIRVSRYGANSTMLVLKVIACGASRMSTCHGRSSFRQ